MNGERTVVAAPVLVFQRVALAILLLKLFVQDLEELRLRQHVQTIRISTTWCCTRAALAQTRAHTHLKGALLHRGFLVGGKTHACLFVEVVELHTVARGLVW